MGFELFGELYQHWKIRTDGLFMPSADKTYHLTLLTLQIKRLVPVFGMVVDQNRFFYSNAIASLHTALQCCFL